MSTITRTLMRVVRRVRDRRNRALPEEQPDKDELRSELMKGLV